MSIRVFRRLRLHAWPYQPIHNDTEWQEEPMPLPDDAAARKNVPLYRGLLCYFPDALAAVAELSRIGNDQHNPGEPLHWAKEKSTDEEDCIVRHLVDHADAMGRGVEPLDKDGVLHLTKTAWRSLAALQRYLDGQRRAVPERVWPGKVVELPRHVRGCQLDPAHEGPCDISRAVLPCGKHCKADRNALGTHADCPR